MKDTNILSLTGKVQHYAWGGYDFIPALLHLENPEHQPFAEYWMGAHDNIPAMVSTGNGQREPLNEFIQKNPDTILGTAVSKRFGRLPYLFKVLDVKDMLSIQVHPEKKAAEAAFAAENEKGTALDAPDRNYKDDNHKPELMVALGDFWLLHGFKPAAALKKILGQTPELHFLQEVFGADNYRSLYETVMNMPQEKVNQHLQPLLDRIVPLYDQGELTKLQEDFWAARAAKTFNVGNDIDRGIFSVYFFNLVNLQAGEAVFQDAGIPHAYLEGQNMEIMANSDNVLRGGLTPKHIDVAELMKHVRFEAVIPNIIKGEPTEVLEDECFHTPAADFELHRILLKKGESVRLKIATAEIFLVYKGKVNANAANSSLSLGQGQCMLAVAGTELALECQEEAVIFRATVPGN